MGELVMLRCAGCGFERKVMHGVGMAYHDFRNVTWDLPDKMQRAVERALAGEGARAEEYFLAPYHCESCGAVRERLYFRIRKSDGKAFSPRYRCGRCDVLLRRIDPSRLQRLPCPRCRGRSWEDIGFGHWD